METNSPKEKLEDVDYLLDIALKSVLNLQKNELTHLDDEFKDYTLLYPIE
ncbi:MAG: hypothetical protein JWR09_3225 [Mucilaginibacter sp.]|nr:hypothetical protein [Mucilaginibacter sp.]